MKHNYPNKVLIIHYVIFVLLSNTKENYLIEDYLLVQEQNRPYNFYC